MTQSPRETERTLGTATADLYHQVQSFYARQMQLLDAGDVEAWAETFTEDGRFSANAHPVPVKGRAAIVQGARTSREALAAKGIRHRHWLGMLDVRGISDGQLLVRSYALVLAIPRGGQATVHVSTTCDDELVRVGDGWQVSSRHVTRDDVTSEQG